MASALRTKRPSHRRALLSKGCLRRKGRIEVLMNGWARRGTDPVKALCLGTRAYCWGAGDMAHLGFLLYYESCLLLSPYYFREFFTTRSGCGLPAGCSSREAPSIA